MEEDSWLLHKGLHLHGYVPTQSPVLSSTHLRAAPAIQGRLGGLWIPKQSKVNLVGMVSRQLPTSTSVEVTAYFWKPTLSFRPSLWFPKRRI
jgi:hypothetical protein